MKCLYYDINCDWPDPTGDIECVDCVHYKETMKSTPVIDWFIGWLDKLFGKKKTT